MYVLLVVWNSSSLGVLAVVGVALLWFRLSMNYDSEPIFKPNELRAAYHSDRSVR